MTVPRSGRSFTATGSMAPISASVFVTADEPRKIAGYPARFALMPASFRPCGFGVRSWTDGRFSFFSLALRRIHRAVRRNSDLNYRSAPVLHNAVCVLAYKKVPQLRRKEGDNAAVDLQHLCQPLAERYIEVVSREERERQIESRSVSK